MLDAFGPTGAGTNQNFNIEIYLNFVNQNLLICKISRSPLAHPNLNLSLDGVFSGGLMSAMTTLRDNRDILLSVLEPFLRDPVIDWKRQRIQEKSGTAENNNKNIAPASIEAKRSIRVIDERLRGIYNLKNPNHKKIRRIDRETQDDDDEMASLMPLSAEGQVHKMIAEATSHENLVQVYVGWMPWL